MIDRQELRQIVERIDQGLAEPQTICLIGSAASILMGQPNRNTEDIDVWSRASKLKEKILRKAVEDAGLLYNPTEDEPNLPYVQVIHPGIVQVPGFNPETGLWLETAPEVVWEGNFLTVTAPPPAVIIASKMTRFEDRDITDSIWLMTAREVDAKSVMRAIRQLPPERREDAAANFDVLKYLR